MIYTGDNLMIMRTMEDESADLIYLDPPFRSQRDYGAFNDVWRNMDEYIEYMRERLKHTHRLLCRTGSIYLHCDDSASHYLKVAMGRYFRRKELQERSRVALRRSGTRSQGRRQTLPPQSRQHLVLLQGPQTALSPSGKIRHGTSIRRPSRAYSPRRTRIFQDRATRQLHGRQHRKAGGRRTHIPHAQRRCTHSLCTGQQRYGGAGTVRARQRMGRYIGHDARQGKTSVSDAKAVGAAHADNPSEQQAERHGSRSILRQRYYVGGGQACGTKIHRRRHFPRRHHAGGIPHTKMKYHSYRRTQ